MIEYVIVSQIGTESLIQIWAVVHCVHYSNETACRVMVTKTDRCKESRDI